MENSSQYVIYADLLFATNFAMDLTILWTTAKILSLPKIWWRLLVAAAVGGIYGTALVLPKFSAFYTIPVEICLPILLIIIVFSWSNVKNMLIQLATFYMTSFAVSGGIYGISSLFHTDQTSALWLIFGIFIAYILASTGIKTLKNFLADTKQIVTAEIYWQEQNATIKCLLDTGNNLKDPLTKASVLVVELTEILNILPEFLQQQFILQKTQKLAIYEIFANCQNEAFCQNLSLIPYSAIGTDTDFLLAIRPEKIVIKGENLPTITTKDLLVALYTGTISAGTNCKGILNPQILYQKKLTR